MTGQPGRFRFHHTTRHPLASAGRAALRITPMADRPGAFLPDQIFPEPVPTRA